MLNLYINTYIGYFIFGKRKFRQHPRKISFGTKSVNLEIEIIELSGRSTGSIGHFIAEWIYWAANRRNFAFPTKCYFRREKLTPADPPVPQGRRTFKKTTNPTYFSTLSHTSVPLFEFNLFLFPIWWVRRAQLSKFNWIWGVHSLLLRSDCAEIGMGQTGLRVPREKWRNGTRRRRKGHWHLISSPGWTSYTALS